VAPRKFVLKLLTSELSGEGMILANPSSVEPCIFKKRVRNNPCRWWLLTVSVLAALAQVALAAPVTVPDFSFEDSVIGTPGGTAGLSTNWSSAGGSYVQNITNSLFTSSTLPAPADGTNFLVEQIGGSLSYVWQDLGPLQSNMTYSLTVGVSQFLDGSAAGKGFIALVNGANPFGTILAATPVDATLVATNSFTNSVVTFSTPYNASGDLTVLLAGTNAGLLPLDNVRLDATPLPQAATALLPSLTTDLGTTLSSPSNAIYIGTPLTLGEVPAGAPPFSYQWQTDNGTGGATFSPVSGANASNYVVDTSALSATVKYRVVVTNSLGSSTSPPVSLTALTGPPVIVIDTQPASALSTVGGSLGFFAVVDGTRPLFYRWQFNGADIANATNATLILTNLQLTDAGSYSLVVSNAQSTTSSTAASLSVNPVPPATNAVPGVIVALDAELGPGGTVDFKPTWPLATNSLIAGQLPSSSVGSFQVGGTGDSQVLTDGRFGILHPAGTSSPDVATCGNQNSAAAQLVTYTLPSSPNGWDITNIVVYGGWSDAGRDQQSYNVLVATFAAPSSFLGIASVNYQPTDTAGVQSATRASVFETNGGPLAKNAAALQLNFNILQPGWNENNYEGYAEIQVFGTPSPPRPVLTADTLPVTGVADASDSVTFTAGFSSTAPLHYQWLVNTGAGPVPIAGGTNTTLTLTDLQLSDSGAYSCMASNSFGVVSSTPNSFTVTNAPIPDANGVLELPANQTGYGGTRFTPTWAIAPGSVIGGVLPAAYNGNFQQENAGGVSALTDGSFGAVGQNNDDGAATAGNSGGQTLVYILPGSTNGWDLTNIVVYGGWSDGGRDEQAYTINYSTITDPTTFVPLTSFDYLPQPPSGVPTTTRVAFTSGTASRFLATNVAALEFDFTTPNGGGENGYQGYNEIALYGTRSAPVSYTLAPTLVEDIEPVQAAEVVGGQATFEAAFASSQPLSYQWQLNSSNIPGATNASLTLNNVQLTDSGVYGVIASNSLGTATSSTSGFNVNPVATPTNGLVISSAFQISATGTVYPALFPTWTIRPGDLLAGKSPSIVGSGNFANGGAGGVPKLTDGSLSMANGLLSSFASGGTGGSGTTVTYQLASGGVGVTVNEIVTYAGWQDGGRDQQHYTVYYSTVASPTNFIALASVSYDPTVSGDGVPSNLPIENKVTIASSTGAPLAMNVAALEFDFTNPGGENGWSGYSELAAYGQAAGLEVHSMLLPGGNLALFGAGGIPGGTYTWLTSTNVATLRSTWLTTITGTFDSSGAFSNAIPIQTSERARFYLLRMP
jgi:hypothetical protein